MELWIRSQDKRHLILVKNILLAEYEDEGIYTLETDLDNGTDFELGCYKTGERALQVLDEIQNAIYINKLFNADINAFQKCLENEGYTEKEISNALKTISTYQIPEE